MMDTVIREWRQTGCYQPARRSTSQPIHDLLPSPTVSASRKKQKTSHSVPSPVCHVMRLCKAVLAAPSIAAIIFSCKSRSCFMSQRPNSALQFNFLLEKDTKIMIDLIWF